MAEVNIPYLFVIKMEDGTPVKISVVGAVVVERKRYVEFAIVYLLNPKVKGRVPEDIEVDNMEHWTGIRS